MKRAAINMMVKMSNEAETKSLTEQFKRLDTDGTGMISIEELKQWMNKIHPEIDQIEV